MQSLDTLKKRLQYVGGNQEGRMQKAKLNSLKKALLYSYQAATAVLADGREFRCLINPNKETGDYDNKILSIPYEDVCLNEPPGDFGTTTKATQPTNIKPGDVFTWKETDTKWIVFLEYLEEDSYFRAQIRRCDQTTTINGKEYWIYIRGPVETALSYNQKAGVEWNDMNHSLEMYITKDDNTISFFRRFATFKIKEEITEVEKTWQVVSMNPYYGDGILKISLDEYFENSVQDAVDKENEEIKAGQQTEEATEWEAYIEGEREIYPYEEYVYTIKNSFSFMGEWYLKSSKKDSEESLNQTSESIKLSTTQMNGTLTLTYKDITGENIASVNIKIKPI